MSVTRSQFAILLFVLLLVPAPSRSSPPKKLTLPQAVQKAERFIAINGYTDLPPSEDSTKLTYEFMELGVPARRNSLERKAFAYAKRRASEAPGWTIIFRYTKSYLSKRPRYYKRYGTRGEQGRGVTMDVYGRDIRMMHTNPYVQAFTKLKRGTAAVPRATGKKDRGKQHSAISEANHPVPIHIRTVNQKTSSLQWSSAKRPKRSSRVLLQGFLPAGRT